jgi:prophage maintenance system killer protein
MNDIAIYESADGQVEVRVDQETIWLTQRQLATLLDTSTDNIGLHLKNIFSEGELVESATTEDFSVVQTEGKRRVTRQVRHYNLDAVLSVGYRVSSTKATCFRQWATRILREHLTRGFTLNRHRLEANARQLEAALELVRRAAQGEISSDQSRGLLDVITRYTRSFLLLQRYDERSLVDPEGTPGSTLPTADEARAMIAALKKELIARGEAAQVFGRERGDAFDAILGNLEQTVFGAPAYPSLESRAAHLLYFVIKDHPFVDGNKRIGSLMFVSFLDRNGALRATGGEPRINDIGLTALALLVAESAAQDKEVVIRLVMNLLAGAEAGAAQ